MSEHPILFNTEMVKAILDGRKTHTRRIITRDNGCDYNDYDGYWVFRDDLWWYESVHGFAQTGLKCPYGQLCDRLWVREKATLKSTGIQRLTTF